MRHEERGKQARIPRSLDPRALRFERWSTRKEQAARLLAGTPDEACRRWLAARLAAWVASAGDRGGDDPR